jgi:hypothetical protein
MFLQSIEPVLEQIGTYEIIFLLRSILGPHKGTRRTPAEAVLLTFSEYEVRR